MRVAKESLRLVCLCSALALGACGGGGGDGGGTPPAATQSGPQAEVAAGLKVNDLTGTWRACQADSATTSLQHQYTFTADSETLASYEYELTAHPSTDCSGAASGSLTRAGKVQFDTGTQSIGSIEAQKVTFAPQDLILRGMSFNGNPTATYKQVLAITAAGILQEGDTSQLDTTGYPKALSSLSYAKAP